VALTLAAGNNKIEYLPPEIFTPLQALRELHLYKNKITAVPPEIGNLVCKCCGFVKSHLWVGPTCYSFQTSHLSVLIYVGEVRTCSGQRNPAVVVVRGCYLCVIFLLLRWNHCRLFFTHVTCAGAITAVFCTRELYALDILTLVCPLSPPSRPCPATQPSRSCRWRQTTCAGCPTRSPPAPPWRSSTSATTPSSPTFPARRGTSGGLFGFCSAPVWCVRVLLCGRRLPSVVSLWMRTLRCGLAARLYLRGGVAAVARHTLHFVTLAVDCTGN
jgi:hypothetical protein